MVFIIFLVLLCIYAAIRDIKHFYLYLLFVCYACIEYTRLNGDIALSLQLPSMVYFILPVLAFLIILFTTKRSKNDE